MQAKTCPKCRSTNINYQVLTKAILKNKYHGILWWIFIGWWWIFVKWLFLTGLAIILFVLKLIGIRRKKLVFVEKTKAVCQNCGYSWDI